MAAPFVLKVLGDAAKVAGPVVSAGFYSAAAAFIALSFILQWRINSAYFQSQALSRQRWMQTLYYYISARERQEISEEPIEQAMRNYRQTRGALAVVYFLLVVALIYFGVVTFQQPAIPPPPVAITTPAPLPSPSPAPQPLAPSPGTVPTPSLGPPTATPAPAPSRP